MKNRTFSTRDKNQRTQQMQLFPELKVIKTTKIPNWKRMGFDQPITWWNH